MDIVLFDFLNKIWDVLHLYALPALGIAVVCTIVRFLITRNKKGLISFSLLVTYTGLIVAETVIRRIGTIKETTDIWGFMELTLDPWFVVAAVENVVMLLPWGFLFALAFRHAKRSFLWCMLTALVMSVAIEVVQYVLVIGEAEVLDVLCGLVGAAVGFWCARGILQIARKKS